MNLPNLAREWDRRPAMLYPVALGITPGLVGRDIAIPSIERSSVCPECPSVGVNLPSVEIKHSHPKLNTFSRGNPN